MLGLGCRVQGLMFRMSEVGVQRLGFLKFRISHQGFRAVGSGFGLGGLRAQGLGFRVDFEA